MSTTTIAPSTGKGRQIRLQPGTLVGEAHRRAIAHQLSAVGEGSTRPMPVVVREADNTVTTSPLAHYQPYRNTPSIIDFKGGIRRRIEAVRNRRRQVEEAAPLATILAIVPTYNEEDDIAATIESLLQQSRPINRIVIMVNNSTDRTAEIARGYAAFFSNLTVEDVNKDDHGVEGKVGALNWAWHKYASHDQFDFVLGVDADVECDPEMVQHLEADLILATKAAGVMARYSFKHQEGAKRSEKRIIYNQRHEFGITGIKQQLRGGRSDILGGQATLFRSEALSKAAEETDGGSPWNPLSAVEDADLTRTFQRLGYKTAVSSKARAWVGPMMNSYAWHKQRMKWEGGHLSDMMRDFHPWLDRRRWLDQIDLAFNLLIRVMFAAMLVTSVWLEKYTFNPLWLVPIGMASFQSFLVASKLPNRTAGEIFRSLLFIPGELYLWKTLAVWVASVSKISLAIKGNLWESQYLAEAAKRKNSWSARGIIFLCALGPIMAMLTLNRFLLNSDQMDVVLTLGWYALTTMTVFSIFWMGFWTLRILRRYRSLQP